MQTGPTARQGKLLRRQVLGEDDIALVREGSLTVLEGTGILIEHPRALTLLAEAGAAVGENSHLAKIPAWLVEKSLRTAPREFVVRGHDPSKDVTLSDESPPRARPVMSLDWIADYGVKRRREVTRQDLEALSLTRQVPATTRSK